MVILENVDKIVSSAATGSQVLDLANLPSGGEQKFVATGAIASGDVVGLKADGTVETVQVNSTSMSQSLGGVEYLSITDNYQSTSLYLEGKGLIFATYMSLSPNEMKYRLEKINPATNLLTTLRSPTTVDSNSFGSWVAMGYDEMNDRILIILRGPSQTALAFVGEVDYSNHTVSFNRISSSSLDGGNGVSYNTLAYDKKNGVFLYGARRQSDGYLWIRRISINPSDNTLDVGTPYNLLSDNSAYSTFSYHEKAEAILMFYQHNGTNPSKGYSRVAKYNSSTGNFDLGSNPYEFSSNGADYMGSSYDSSKELTSLVFRDNADNLHVKSFNISALNPVEISTSVVPNSTNTHSSLISFCSELRKHVIFYKKSLKPTVLVAELDSANNWSFESSTIPLDSVNNSNYLSVSQDTSNGKVLLLYKNDTNLYLTARVLQIAGTKYSYNASTWLGIANEAIPDTQTGAVTLYGGVAKNLTGLTPNTKYYVNYDGTLTDTPNEGQEQGTYGEIGMALSSDKLLITSGNL